MSSDTLAIPLFLPMWHLVTVHGCQVKKIKKAQFDHKAVSKRPNGNPVTVSRNLYPTPLQDATYFWIAPNC